MGYTKNLLTKDIEKTKKDIRIFLNSIKVILPCNYNGETIIQLLNKYYPHEISLIDQKNDYYFYKERSLISKGKKSRYVFKSSREFITSSSVYSELVSKKYKTSHENNFDEAIRQENISKLEMRRNPKISKIATKIEKAKLKTQQMEPEFLDILIGLYNRKSTSQMDKVHIIKELEKYYCKKVLMFFSKVIDTEYNLQLRQTAFYHLQSLGFQPVMRKQKYMRIPSKNKKRRKEMKNNYANENYNIKQIPQELEYRLASSKEQKIKTYDFFISHSSADHNTVQMLISYLNKNSKHIYCDWINDTDYLKRSLVGKATFNVIINRMNQSKEMIFVESTNSLKSNWCKYELNYFYKQQKKIYFLSEESIKNGTFDLEEYGYEHFYNKSYEDIILF